MIEKCNSLVSERPFHQSFPFTNDNSHTNISCDILFQHYLSSRPSLRMIINAINKSQNNSNSAKLPLSVQYFLGPALSGAPFHSHGPALNYLVNGQKLWVVAPPGKDIYSKQHPVLWETMSIS